MTSAISSATTSAVWQSVRSRDNDGDNDGGGRMDKAMQGVAKLLGMTTDELKTAQQSGTTLADLAKSKGVSTSDLTTTLAQGLKENAPSGAPSGTDFTQMATDIINGKGPDGSSGTHGTQGHHRHHHGSGTNTASTDLSSLLNQYGIDTNQLSSLLSSSSTSSSSASSASSSTDSSTTNSSPSDFVTQLKNLISQYGSKGLTYDTTL